jgi:hypothetical protein
LWQDVKELGYMQPLTDVTSLEPFLHDVMDTSMIGEILSLFFLVFTDYFD